MQLRLRFGIIVFQCLVIPHSFALSLRAFCFNEGIFPFLIRFCHLYYEERHYCWLTDIEIAK